MKIYYGKTYVVTATPNEGFKCTGITFTADNQEFNPEVVIKNNIGTSEFKIDDDSIGLKSISATFEKIEDPGDEVTINQPENGSINVEVKPEQ